MPAARPLTHRCRTPQGRRSRQRGVYALEWAIIFPVFFMLLYAIISYGLTFLVRESMQYAVEDGVRAVLRSQPGKEHLLNLEEGRRVVRQKLSWLPDSLILDDDSIVVTVCPVGEGGCLNAQTCAPLDGSHCLVRLELTIDYGNKLVPGLGMLGMDVFSPSRLSASASIMVQRGGV